MRILAFSDVGNWNGYTRAVRQFEPTVVVLAGDLTSDGCADFWHTALEAIPAYRTKRRALERKLSKFRAESKRLAVWDEIYTLQDHYRDTPAFLAARRLHVDRFYRFLKRVGSAAQVLVVKGDHDDDFPAITSPNESMPFPAAPRFPERLTPLAGGRSWASASIKAGLRRPLRAMIAQFRGQAGIVVAHAPQKNVRLLAELQPRLIIRGHFGAGRFVVDDVPAVFTTRTHAIIDVSEENITAIRCADSRSERGMMRDYPWLQPYVPSTG